MSALATDTPHRTEHRVGCARRRGNGGCAEKHASARSESCLHRRRAISVASPQVGSGVEAGSHGRIVGPLSYYDPATAQFLTVDPITTLTRDRYDYAGSSPTNAADPSGLDWRKDVVNVSGGVLDGLTLGHAEEVLDWTTGATGRVDYSSGWAGIGWAAGTAVLLYGSFGTFTVGSSPVVSGAVSNSVGWYSSTWAAYNVMAACPGDDCANAVLANGIPFAAGAAGSFASAGAWRSAGATLKSAKALSGLAVLSSYCYIDVQSHPPALGWNPFR